MTYDQGSEMRHHKRLTAKHWGRCLLRSSARTLGAGGINENTNGLLIQYLPEARICRCFPRNNWTISPGY